MNKPALFLMILLGVGLFLWMQKDQLPLPESTATGAPASTAPATPGEPFILRKKIKPGGYIGWHQTERDPLTNNHRQTRQASNFYFVCTGRTSGAEKIFQVPEQTFNMEKIGNILSASQMSQFQEVSAIEEPSLPKNFEFRRRAPTY